MTDLILKLKALGEVHRFRVAMMLLERPLCVCELLSVLDITGATLSNHLKILRNAGLIGQKKDGRWMVYYPEDSALELLTDMHNEVEDKSQINRDVDIVRTLNREMCSLSGKK